MTCQSQTWPKHAIKHNKYLQKLKFFCDSLFISLHFKLVKNDNLYVPAV